MYFLLKMDEHGDFPASHVSELRGVNASFQNAISVVDLVSRLFFSRHSAELR